MSGPVLVTGAAGFAGGYQLQRLSGHCELVAWARSEPEPELAPLARWQRVDLRDRQRVRTLIAEIRPSEVYHLAGFSHVAESFKDTTGAFANNVLATHHLFDGLRRAGVRCRVLVTGSAAVYATSNTPLAEDAPLAPQSPYAVSKLAQELLGARAREEDGLEVLLVRPFNHTGPRQTPSYMAPAVARQIALIERGELDPVLHIGNTSAVRDITDVRDVVGAYEALMRDGTPGVPYNVASGVGWSVRQIIDALTSRSAVAVRVEVDQSKMRPSDTPVLIGDSTRVTAATGWRPQIPFEQMIDDLLDYWRKRKS